MKGGEILEFIEEKIYSGLLGKAIGVRLGAPIEPYQWDYDRIRESFEDIRGYVKPSDRFAADDDTNGPIFFIRVVLDKKSKDITTEDVGKAWLNYTRDGQGMFWWGGSGVSTEHTAYENLKKGLSPGNSGSAEVNGLSLSEQVGGQIFIDSWGLIHPGNIDDAMDAAERAAAVSHDGEALVGARFIAGLIAGAFENQDRLDLIDSVLSKLPETSAYKMAMEDLLCFYKKHPEDFRKAYEYAQENYSYSHYEGLCPLIPNACIVLIGLLYGENDFSRSIEITCMCGWDTDSNAGVVGTVMGVLKGLENIPSHYRDPIHDIVIGSSMSPTLNVTNLPLFAKILSGIARGEIAESHDLSLDFSFTGSTSGIRIRNDFRLLRDEVSRRSLNGYDILVDNLVTGDEAAIYYQTFYERNDFGDNRYDPVFAPLVYPGQKLTVELMTEISFLDDLWFAPYLRYTNGYEIVEEYQRIENGEKRCMEMILPACGGSLIKEVGIKVKTESSAVDGNGVLGRIKLSKFEVKGSADYIINSASFAKGFLNDVTPFSNHRIKTELVEKRLRLEALNQQGVCFTGHYFSKDTELYGTLHLIEGENILIAFRVKGMENYYYVRITPEVISIERRLDRQNLILHSIRVKTDLTKALDFNLIAKKEQVIFITNNRSTVISYEGIDNEYGHFGFGGKSSTFDLYELHVRVNS